MALQIVNGERDGVIVGGAEGEKVVGVIVGEVVGEVASVATMLETKMTAMIATIDENHMIAVV